MKGGIFDVAALKAADIGGPPGNARHRHIQPGGELVAQRMKRGVHVARPRQHAVALAACPGAAHQVDDLRFPLLL